MSKSIKSNLYVQVFKGIFVITLFVLVTVISSHKSFASQITLNLPYASGTTGVGMGTGGLHGGNYDVMGNYTFKGGSGDSHPVGDSSLDIGFYNVTQNGATSSTPAVALANGTVLATLSNTSCHAVLIDYGDEGNGTHLWGIYLHMANIQVSPGNNVTVGQAVGYPLVINPQGPAPCVEFASFAHTHFAFLNSTGTYTGTFISMAGMTLCGKTVLTNANAPRGYDNLQGLTSSFTVPSCPTPTPSPTPTPTPTPTVPPTKVGLKGIGMNASNGATQAFKLDAGGILTTNWQYGAEGNWHGWTDTTQYYRQYQAPPAIIQNQPGGLQGFALGKDGYIYTAYEQTVGDSSTWNTWTATSTSNQFISPPTVSSQSNGFLDVFSVGADGHPYHKFQYTDGSWSSWVAVGGNTPSLRGSISAVQYPNGNGLQAFARGADNTIYTSWEVSASNNANWTNWTAISSGNFAGDPVAYNQAYGQMDVFALDTSGHLEHYYQNASNGNNWTGWTTLSSASFVGAPTIAQYPNGKGLQVFIRGGDKTIYTIYELSATNDANWSSLTQFTPDSPNSYIQSVGIDPVVINQTNGNMDIFDRSLDNNNSVWHTFQNAANGNRWSAWTQVSSGSNAGKMGYRGVGINIDGSIQAFKRDASNYMESNYQIGAEGAWHGWNYTSPSNLAFATDPTVVQYVGGGLAAFARGADNTIYTSQQVAAGDSASWNSWTQLGTQTFAGTPIAVNQSNGYIDVFARGSDNEIWHNYQDANNGGAWHGWVVVMAGGFTGDPSIVQYQGDTLQAFARAAGSNAIYTTWENSSADDSSWTAFALIDSTPFSSDPYASVQANGYLDVAAKDMSGNIYHNYYVNGRNWHGWVGIAAGGFGGLPAMIQNASGNLQLFEKGGDAHLYTNSQTNPFDDSTWNANAFSQLSAGSFSTDPIAIEQMNGYLDIYLKDTNGNWWHMFQDSSGNWSGGYNF